jgi:hypothetical protein
VRVDGSEVVEVPAAEFGRLLALEVLNPSETGPAPFLGGLGGAGYQKALAESELLNQRSRNIRVGRLGCVVAGRVAEKTEALGVKFQDAVHFVLVVRHGVT